MDALSGSADELRRRHHEYHEDQKGKEGRARDAIRPDLRDRSSDWEVRWRLAHDGQTVEPRTEPLLEDSA